MDKKQLKKDMVAHAKECGENLPKINVKNGVWGLGARRLAWRITNKHAKASTKPQAVYNVLHPKRFSIIMADWGCRPVGTRSSTQYITLHHAAGNLSAARVNALHKQNGWACIGYHFYIEKSGKIYRGRNENAIGSHAVNDNSISLGICFEGNYDRDKTMPKAQLEAGKWLVARERKRYPKAKVVGHRDMPHSATACPGRFFPMKEIAG